MKIKEYTRTLAESMDEFKTTEELLLLGIQYGLKVALKLSEGVWSDPRVDKIAFLQDDIRAILSGSRDLPEVE